MEKLAAPPGFVSRTSFLLKKIQCDDEARASTNLRRGFKRALKQDATEVIADVVLLKRSLGSRPWILYDQTSSLEKSDSDKCAEEKARHLAKDLKAEVLEEAPVFYPTEEEFDNTLEYIRSIRQQAEAHGICRIVPPSSWKPPCRLKNKAIWQNSTFATRIQLFGGIQSPNRNQKNKKAIGDDAKSVRKANEVRYCRIDHGPEFTLEKFKEYVDDFKDRHFRRKDMVPNLSQQSISERLSEPSTSDIEYEYLQLVDNPKLEVGVVCGDDLDSRSFGSGFSSVSGSVKTHESENYSGSGWNLTNTPKIPGYLFSSEDCNPSIRSVPRLRIGMCFSSEFWKVERHRLYSLSYMHLGAQRVWYVAPGQYYLKFEATMRNLVPDFSRGTHKLPQKTIPTVSPFAFKAEGIPVHRCIQNPGDYIIIFSGSHYSGFDCGFNCSEIVNFAPPDWLPHGLIAAEQHQEKQRKMLISYDKLMLETAKEAVKALLESSLSREKTANNIKRKYAAGKDGILTKTLKARIRMEKNKRELLFNPLQARPMDKIFDATLKRECCICFWDLHLSAVRCPCSADRHSCLNHFKQLCSCPWADKIFLFRYTLEELNLLLEALEGKRSAVYRWGRLNSNISSLSTVSRESETKIPLPEEPIKKKDTLVDDAMSSGIDVTMASIKAEVKARSRAKATKRTAKVNEERVVSSGETEEKYTSPRSKTHKRNIASVPGPAESNNDGDQDGNGDEADDDSNEDDVNDDDYNDDDDTNNSDDDDDDEKYYDNDDMLREKTNARYRSRRIDPLTKEFRFPSSASNIRK